MGQVLNKPNRKRVFEEVVSVEAWHTGFSSPSGIATVHADIVFLEARLGQEDESPVRFKLRLRRAEVLVVVPENEPLKVLQESVARDQSVSSGRFKSAARKEKRSEGMISGSANVSGAPSINAGVKLEAGVASNEEAVLEIDTPVRLILTTQSKTAKGAYRWEVKPVQGNALEGKPWEAITEPRLKIKDCRENGRHLEGVCRVEVKCKREDLLIEDIDIKDQNILQKIIGQTSFHNKMAAVEAYIRDSLTGRDLDFSDLSDKYSDVWLASVQVETVVR